MFRATVAAAFVSAFCAEHADRNRGNPDHITAHPSHPAPADGLLGNVERRTL
jgi:hypothetical protein